MSDLFGIGASALNSYRRALDTIGHNVANANTPGYSRQRVELATRPPTGAGNGVFGNGVAAVDVTRQFDQLAQARIVGETSTAASYRAQASTLARIDSLLSDPATGPAAAMNRLFSSVEAVAADPTSTATRQQLLADAQDFAARSRTAAARLDTLTDEVGFEIAASVATINDTTSRIAALNVQIAQLSASSGGHPPNDLLDQRDQLVTQLAGEIGVRTVDGTDGRLNVFATSGQALVLDSSAYGLETRATAPGRLPDITVATTGGAVAITRQVGDGRLGGLLQAGASIDSARGQLTQLVVGLTEQVNQVHAQGEDANGNPGGALFAPAAVAGAPATANTGTASLTVSIADPAGLPTPDPELRFNGTAWTRRAADGSETAVAGSGSAADPLQIDGLRVVVGGAAAAGDRFTLRMGDTLGATRVAITQPSAIAAAAPGTGGGDNTNANALADLARSGWMNGDRPADRMAALTANVGSASRSAEAALAGSEALLAADTAERDAVSGVNLDEEAANLLRYEQAYQAAAQVMSVASDVFDTLLAAVRR